jgi:hypothetical protein
MRWLILIALAVIFPGATALAQTSSPAAPSKPKNAPTHLPTPTAEPENPDAYAAPAKRESDGPSDADVGPIQKHFVRASTKDGVTAAENQDNASIEMPNEKIKLDKRISIPLIHDVQDDGSYKGAGNHALQYELKYLNWGAVTQEQLNARQGHYFTITWVNDGPKSDFTTRFEYRQVVSKEVVRILKQDMPHASGASRSYFAVVSKAYLAYGPVSSWRFTVLKGDTVVAEAKSFIW